MKKMSLFMMHNIYGQVNVSYLRAGVTVVVGCVDVRRNCWRRHRLLCTIVTTIVVLIIAGISNKHDFKISLPDVTWEINICSTGNIIEIRIYYICFTFIFPVRHVSLSKYL